LKRYLEIETGIICGIPLICYFILILSPLLFILSPVVLILALLVDLFLAFNFFFGGGQTAEEIFLKIVIVVLSILAPLLFFFSPILGLFGVLMCPFFPCLAVCYFGYRTYSELSF
jgi:hypothetical protein